MNAEVAKEIPTRLIKELTPETPINPGMWKITGVDMSSPYPPEHADFSHGLLVVDDPTIGTCIVLNKDGGDENGHYFNLIGGASEPNESPQQTFTREMIEETGVTPNTDRLHYVGLVETTNAPSTPLYTYRMRSEDMKPTQPITGSEELALVPISLLKKSVPSFPWEKLGL